jgi:hypothetical protein
MPSGENVSEYSSRNFGSRRKAKGGNDDEGGKENYGEGSRNAKKHFAAKRWPKPNTYRPDDDNGANVEPKAQMVSIVSTHRSNTVAPSTGK